MDGEYIWYEEHILPLFSNGELIGWHGLYRNIDHAKKLQTTLQYKANHDVLTTMYNRDFFEERFKELNMLQQEMAVIVCDVDRLKYVNDTFGHKAGDDLIRDTARLLKSLASSNTEFFRIGGDEFVIFLKGVSEQTALAWLSKINTLEQQYNQQHTIPLSISKGCAYSRSSFQMMEKLYKQADNAMYENKQKRKNEMVQYT